MEKFMGFASPNYTQTPNDFFDDLLKEIEDLTELKVTLVALRQTFGYHRERAELSVSFFEKMTGLSRNGVRNGIELAVERGTIQKVKDATPRTGAIYEVVIRGSASDPLGVTERPSGGQPVTPLNKELKKVKDNNSVSAKPAETTPKVQFFPKSTIDTEDTKPAKKNRSRDLPIAVQKFYEVRHRTPPKETWAMIQDTVGTEKAKLDFWKDVLVKYAALGWNPMNVDGALEWFKKGELPHTNGKEKKDDFQIKREADGGFYA